jgi:hypothetical protein
MDGQQEEKTAEQRAAELVKIHITGKVQTIALDGVALAALDIESTEDECEVREQASVVRRALAAIIRDAEIRTLERVREEAIACGNVSAMGPLLNWLASQTGALRGGR